MTLGSLFAGIGGMDVGFHRAGFDVKWQVEIEPKCRQELSRLWPDVTRYEDIREVAWHTVEPVDVLAGGFPCQGISAAGKRKGLRDERSALWWEMWDAARILRPRYIVVENVSRLVSAGLDVVLGSLSEIGYDAEWQPLRACTFGAPHRRTRLFIIAYPCGVTAAQAFAPPSAFGEGWGSWKDDRWGLGGSEPGPLWALSDEDVSGEADGLAFAYGNAVVPAVAEYVASCVMHHANAFS